MISACAFSALLEHPASPVRASVMNADVRRFLAGLAMGMTAILLIYSPLGQRSGAHMNPATTLTFYRLGKVERWDAIFYMFSQFAGALLGTWLAFAVLGAALAHREVNFAITRPGMRGEAVAFFSELFIAFLLMTVILNVSNSRKFARYTGLAAGTMVMLFITFEAPTLRHEHESGAQLCQRFCRHAVAGTLDLLRRAGRRHVIRRRGIRADARHPFRALRQAEPFGDRALHFPLRIHDAGASAGRLNFRGQG